MVAAAVLRPGGERRDLLLHLQQRRDRELDIIFLVPVHQICSSRRCHTPCGVATMTAVGRPLC